jgi:hypothetical protein
MDILFAQSLFRERMYESVEMPSGMKMAIGIGGTIYYLLTLTWLTMHLFANSLDGIVETLRSTGCV